MTPEPSELWPTRRTLLLRLKDLDDQKSWREFFDSYSNLIYSVALKAGLNDAEAKDVVQETVISVARKMDGFNYDPAKGSFKAWLLRLTHWRITDQLRQRRHRGVQAASPTDCVQPASVLDQVLDPNSSPLDRLWDEEWKKALVAAALERIKSQINSRHFQIFELCVLQQWPPAQVARTLRVSTARVYLVRHRVSALFKKAVHQVEAHWSQMHQKRSTSST
jgi:RNA polymerase sigma-70 factor (ECF subfamily)